MSSHQNPVSDDCTMASASTIGGSLRTGTEDALVPFRRTSKESAVASNRAEQSTKSVYSWICLYEPDYPLRPQPYMCKMVFDFQDPDFSGPPGAHPMYSKLEKLTLEAIGAIDAGVFTRLSAEETLLLSRRLIEEEWKKRAKRVLPDFAVRCTSDLSAQESIVQLKRVSEVLLSTIQGNMQGTLYYFSDCTIHSKPFLRRDIKLLTAHGLSSSEAEAIKRWPLPGTVKAMSEGSRRLWTGIVRTIDRVGIHL